MSNNKVYWTDPLTKKSYHAGGILFYNQDGFYAVKDVNRQMCIEYNDFGGKFVYEDMNIYGTIARELCEKSYQLCQLVPEFVRRLSLIFPPFDLNDEPERYYSLCVDLNDKLLEEEKQSSSSCIVKFDSDKFSQAKKTIIEECGNFKGRLFRELEFIKFDEAYNYPLGFRLEIILSELNKRLKKNTSSFSETTYLESQEISVVGNGVDYQKEIKRVKDEITQKGTINDNEKSLEDIVFDSVRGHFEKIKLQNDKTAIV